MSMRPVTCDVCDNEVLVEKRSLPHTSVQWTRSTDCCPELRDGGARIEVCTRLRTRIEQAVSEGVLRVGDDD